MTRMAEGSGTFSFIIENLEFLGLLSSTDEGLRLELLGDAAILLISVLMKGVIKLHHLFYNKPLEKPQKPSASVEDLETQANNLEKKFLEKVRKQNERKKLREIYEMYLISSPLEDM